MNEETPQPVEGLAAVLERATDAVDAPGLATTALAEARRRRVRRRTSVVAGAAASVLLVLGAVQVLDRDAARTPSEPASPAPTPVPPSPTETSAVDRSAAVLPRWDPFTVVDDPFRETVLPARLEPPAAAPPLAEDPMPAAVVAWPAEGEDLRLLGTDGRWRSVPGTADAVEGTLRDVVRPALSGDGREVALGTDDGILVVDVTTANQRTLPWAPALAGPWDDVPEVRWLPGDAGFAVLHWRGTWLVEQTGAARKAPFGGPYGLGLAIDPEGTVVQRRWKQYDLRVWDADEVVSTAPYNYWGGDMAAGHGRVVFAGGASDLPLNGGPTVVDAATGDLVAHAPIRDPNAIYTDNGHLRALGFLDADTVLFKVGPTNFRTMEPGTETWHLIAWDVRTGGVERLTSGSRELREADVATGVLAADWDR